ESTAQKTFVTSDSIVAKDERMSVKKRTKWMGKIARWRFGDYAVVSSKTGGTTTSTKGKLFKTKTESGSTEKFSFVLTNGTTDSAIVIAARNVNVQELHKLDLGHGWSLGSYELVLESENFTAFITINPDTTETWT